MISKKLLFGFLLVLMLSLVVASQTVQNFPGPFTRHTATTINFTWTPSGSDLGDSKNYLFIEALGNGTFFFNRSVDCTNNTLCNLSVSNFIIGRYQWKIQTAENSTNATNTSSNSEPYDTRTAEVVANLTGGTTETWNTTNAEVEATLTGGTVETWNLTLNRFLNFTYTVSGVEETCAVTFAAETLNVVQVGTNITNAGCNVTVTNSSGYLKLATSGRGIDEYIKDIVGNASDAGFLNLSSSLVVNGTETGTNRSLSITYTVSGVEEFCSLSFPELSILSVVQVAQNISAVCNVTASNSSGYLNIVTLSGGVDDYLNVSGNSTTANFLNLSNTRVSGTESGNVSIAITYTINGVSESCSLDVNLADAVYTDSIISNITAVCNISVTNSSGAIKLTTKGHGLDEFINVTGGNSTNILGFIVNIKYLGTQDNFTSNSSYFDIRSGTGGNLTINLLNDTRIYGDLFLLQPPAECPENTTMSQFVGNASTCVGTIGLTIQLNMSGCNITFTGGRATGFEGCA